MLYGQARGDVPAKRALEVAGTAGANNQPLIGSGDSDLVLFELPVAVKEMLRPGQSRGRRQISSYTDALAICLYTVGILPEGFIQMPDKTEKAKRAGKRAQTRPGRTKTTTGQWAAYGAFSTQGSAVRHELLKSHPAEGAHARAGKKQKAFQRFANTLMEARLAKGDVTVQPIKIVEAIREGFSIEFLDDLRESGRLSNKEVHVVIAPARTIAHRRKKSGRLSQEQSERALRVAGVIGAAEKVFGNDRAFIWLRRPSMPLGGVTPLSLLDTQPGADAVLNLLGKIDHGIAA